MADCTCSAGWGSDGRSGVDAATRGAAAGTNSAASAGKGATDADVAWGDMTVADGKPAVDGPRNEAIVITAAAVARDRPLRTQGSRLRTLFIGPIVLPWQAGKTNLNQI